VISADNPGRRLLPGMTAILDIVTGASQNVLTVDNRALRFEPRGSAESLLTAEGKQALVALREDDDNNGFPGGGFPGGGFAGGGGFGGGQGGPGGQGGGRRGGGGGFGGGLIERISADLDLTETQIAQIQSGMQANFAAIQAAGDGGQPDFQSIRTRMASTIEGVLTPEQLERYREMQSELEPGRRVTVWVQTASGQIEARQVALGVEDAQRTEILGGNVNEGDLVVVRVRERAS
jgi:HlyD family secretion protein